MLATPELMAPSELARLEETIEQGRETFVEVGRALLEIRDRRGYRFSHKTFEQYLEQRWKMSRRTGYNYIEAAQVMENVPLTAQNNNRPGLSQAVELASLPAVEQTQLLGEVDLSTTTERELRAIVRGRKEAYRESLRQQNRALVETTSPMPVHVFSTIVLDPPWDWGDEGDQDQFGRARPPYHTMSIDEIQSLPIPSLAADDAHLYLWITNRSLPKGFGLLEAWGFRYITCLTWCKPSFGMGNYFRGSTEQVLFAVRGSLPILERNLGTWFQAPRGSQHSEKPAEFFSTVERASPGPWLEMFARCQRPGWVVWGAETGA